MEPTIELLAAFTIGFIVAYMIAKALGD